MTIAPELVAEAVRLGLITETEAPRFLHPSPPEPRIPRGWSNDAERLEAAIRGCASGAPAITGITMTVEEIDSGRTIPAPPTGDAA